jgi:hypothetical protein
MDSLYSEPSPVSIPGEPRFKRQTIIRHVGGGDADLDDYRVVTVIITSLPMRHSAAMHARATSTTRRTCTSTRSSWRWGSRSASRTTTAA